MSRSVPFHEALRIAVEARGLALERISAHLHARGHTISIATLSYWQSGRSLPGRPASLRALGALESILDVPRGHLAGLLPGPPPAAAAPITPLALAPVLPAPERLDRIVAHLGRPRGAPWGGGARGRRGGPPSRSRRWPWPRSCPPRSASTVSSPTSA